MHVWSEFLQCLPLLLIITPELQSLILACFLVGVCKGITFGGPWSSRKFCWERCWTDVWAQNRGSLEPDSDGGDLLFAFCAFVCASSASRAWIFCWASAGNKGTLATEDSFVSFLVEECTVATDNSEIFLIWWWSYAQVLARGEFRAVTEGNIGGFSRQLRGCAWRAISINGHQGSWFQSNQRSYFTQERSCISSRLCGWQLYQRDVQRLLRRRPKSELDKLVAIRGSISKERESRLSLFLSQDSSYQCWVLP